MEWKKTVLHFLFLKKQMSLYLYNTCIDSDILISCCMWYFNIPRKDWKVEKGVLASTFGILQHVTVYIYWQIILF